MHFIILEIHWKTNLETTACLVISSKLIIWKIRSWNFPPKFVSLCSGLGCSMNSHMLNYCGCGKYILIQRCFWNGRERYPGQCRTTCESLYIPLSLPVRITHGLSARAGDACCLNSTPRVTDRCWDGEQLCLGMKEGAQSWVSVAFSLSLPLSSNQNSDFVFPILSDVTVYCHKVKWVVLIFCHVS